MAQEISALEAAQRADLSKDHLLRLLRTKKIQARQVSYPGGYYWMVDVDSLEAYIHNPAARKPGKKHETKAEASADA